MIKNYYLYTHTYTYVCFESGEGESVAIRGEKSEIFPLRLATRLFSAGGNKDVQLRKEEICLGLFVIVYTVDLQ